MTASLAIHLAAAFLLLGDDAPDPSPPPARDPARLGERLQRTMSLLASSTQEHRRTVRILFYGQSITEQAWSRQVADDLRRRFPSADLKIENRAIGGFASQILRRTAEHDLYPFYPDLLIFHVYGGNREYEEIIAATRRRTTAEILMQTDHVTQWPSENPDPSRNKGLWWDHMMNQVFLPEIAKKYGCRLADVRGGWLDHLKANKLQPKDLLKDGVHLNAHGDRLMAKLIERELVLRENSSEAWKDWVRTFPVGAELRWRDGRLQFDFDGNRVDLLAAAPGNTRVKVLIDGKPPSAFPGAYRITRPSVTQAGFWPSIIRIGSEKPLQVEDWTLRVTAANDQATEIAFTVTGSKTGPDGSGTSSARFVSRSGRVVVEPDDWWLKRTREFTGKKVPAGFEIHWRVEPMSLDVYRTSAFEPHSENATTIVQSIPNAKHHLELITDGAELPALASIRVYRPPIKSE